MTFKKNHWTSTLCTALVSALSLGAVGCDEAPSEAPEAFLIANSGVAVVRGDAGQAAPAVRERKSSFTPVKATTKPWEPGSGYYDRVDVDVYYDTCPPGHPDPEGVVSVYELVVDPVQKEVNTFEVYLEIPEELDLNDENGPIEVGDRKPSLIGCEYTGLYAKCPGREIAFDLGTILPGMDATFVFKSEGAHVFFDYGHKGYRVLSTTTQSCVGADCDDPIVVDVIGGEPVNCSTMQMAEYDRVPDPEL